MNELEQQIAALVMTYGKDRVVSAAERVTNGNKAPLILLNEE